MPREFRIAAPVPVDLVVIAQAAAVVDDSLAVRAIAHGQVIQLVDVADETILSIQVSRLLDDPADAVRVAPTLDPGALTGPQHWVEAFAPWTSGGAQGALVVVELARMLHGSLERSDA